jgi:hypothetical protein
VVGKRLDNRHSKDREDRRTLTHLLERWIEDEGRMELSQDRDQWRAFASALFSQRVLLKDCISKDLSLHKY